MNVLMGHNMMRKDGRGAHVRARPDVSVGVAARGWLGVSDVVKPKPVPSGVARAKPSAESRVAAGAASRGAEATRAADFDLAENDISAHRACRAPGP
jgi:hypothetical protein